MKIALRVLLAVAAFLILLFNVPEFDESPPTHTEAIEELKLGKDGDRLFVRTVLHDYDLALPPNPLNEAVTAVRSDTGSRAPAANIGHLDLSNLAVDPHGQVKGDFYLSIGGYYSRELPSVIGHELRAKLTALGFSPTNQNHVGDFSPSLFMAWSTKLTGRQYPSKTRLVEGAVDIGAWGADKIDVTDPFDPAVLERHRRINAAFAPLVAVKGFVIVVMLSLVGAIFGFNPWPSG